ncbi:MAG: ABC transporter permease [Chloroflexota bacterium]
MTLSMLLQRVWMGILTAFGVSVVIFVLLSVLPGDPLAGLLPESAQPQDRDELAQQLGLDKPLPVRYINWLGDLSRGDLGYSPFRRRNVSDLIAAAWGNTVILAVASAVVGLGMGVVAGVTAAVFHGKWPDRLISTLSLTGLSVPSYFVAILLIIIFSAQLKLLPGSGMYGTEGGLFDLLSHLVMPLIAGSLVTLGVTARVARASVVEAFGADFVELLRAKGLRFHQVLPHVIKNAASPVLTTSGLQVGNLLGGAVLIETIFSWPGVGSLVYTAISARDLRVVQGATLVIALTFVVLNVVVDLLQMTIDPRQRGTA